MTRPLSGTLLAFLLVTAGCANNDDEAASTTTSAPKATSTTTGPPPTTTTPPDDERVEAVTARLLQIRNDAFAAPDPAKVDDYLSPGCDCYEEERATLENLQSRGWHWETPMFEVLGVRVSDRTDPALVTLTIVARRPPERVVDATGALVKPEGPGLQPTGYSFLLVQRDGDWRIADNFELDLRPDLLEEIMRQGIPA